jgi:nitrile hydratase
MNGVHDMGGMHGMGPVVAETNEPVFHTAWERRTFAITMAAGFLGKWNIDMSRFARELMPPAEYLAASYYERWLFGLEVLVVATGLMSKNEIEAAVDGTTPAVGTTPEPPFRVLQASDVGKVLLKGGSARVDADVAAKFRAGDRVLARNINPVGHTRIPRYVRGRRGVVDRDHGVFVFPDTHAAGEGQKPQHVYSVRFTAHELWGADPSSRHAVYVDLWDDYLEPA